MERLVAPARVEEGEPTLLVLLHGLGSNEADLFALTPELDPRLSVVSLRAPFEYAYGGFAWFDIQWDGQGVAFRGEDAQSSLDQLVEGLTSLQAEMDVRPNRTILGGFSQGAMMTIGVLFQRSDLIGGALVLSGCLIPGFDRDQGLTSLPVFQGHGTMDPIIPVDLGRQVRQVLAAKGAKVDYHEYPMAHEVSYACLRDAGGWLEGWLNQNEPRTR